MKVGCNQRTVVRIWSQYQRKRKFQEKLAQVAPERERTDRRIRKMDVADRTTTVPMIQAALPVQNESRPALNIINNRLIESELRSRRPLLRIPLSARHRSDRLNWMHIRHRPQENDHQNYIVERNTARTSCFMPVVLPFLEQNNNCIFQQDNARPHTTNISRVFFQNANILPWTSCFPDISPIEDVWDIMESIESNPGPRYTKQTTLELDKDKDIGGLITALSAKMDDWGQKIETRFASVEQGLEKINQRLQQLETSLETTSKVASDNSKRIADLEGRLEHCEMKQRERNLIFYGFEGAENETPDESRSRVLNLISSSMQISEEIRLEQCRRLSRKANSPLLIEVPDYKQRILLLRNAFKLRDKKIFLNKDYPATPATKTTGRGRGSGGIIVGVKKGGHYRLHSTEKDNIWISIFLSQNIGTDKPTTCLIFVYLPPNELYQNNLVRLTKYMEKQITDGKELILIGDLNIRTGGLGGLYNPTNLQLSLVSERKARDLVISPLAEGLLESLEDNSLTIINGRSTGDREGDFTYVSERGSSTIDYCIVSQGILEKILDFRIETQMYSDHLPLILKLTVQNTYENKSKGEEYGVTRYRWTAGGFKTFKQELKELQVVKISNLDSSVNTFTQRITEAMSTSGIMYSTKGATGKSKPWFDKNCYDMKKLTKESLKEFRRTNRKEDLESYALHRKKYLGLLDDKRRKYIQEKQEILRNIKDSKSFWKTIALFKGATKIQGEITVQEWHEFYCELMSIEEKENICNIEVRISPSDPILDPEITSEEIGRAIRDLKNNKASGPDDIPNEIIKILPDSYMGLLEQFYNRALIMGHYPTIWTKSIIHPIFKSGDKDNPSNYRGIALISNFSKLFTTILRSRLNEWVERRNVIPENQAGFRRGRSCVDLIFTLTSLIQLSLRKKRGKLYVFFVDLRKAFDTVPHSLLWKKLTNLGVSYQFIHAIRNYYEQATVAIRWRGSITENIKIHSGLLQGEPLSPLLFILFMTDLIKMYDNSDLTSVYLPEFGDVHLLMYADDIAIIGESRLNLQKKINILKEYLGVNEMTLNESKSKVMVFRNGGKPSREDRWYWNGKPLTVTRRYNYLGYPLVSTTKTTQAANFFKGKALAAINATTPILAKSKINSLNSAMKLFDSIVMAVLMYAAPIWATEYKDLLDHIQDTFIRRFLSLPRYTPGYIIRPETGRVSLIITALKLTLKYWLRVLSMDTNRLPRICLTRMRQLSCATGAPIGFIKQLSNLLNNNGSSWLTYCNDPDSLRNAIPGILRTAIEQSIQNDLTRITQSKLYSHYRDIYTTFTTEEYFLTELPFPIIRLIAQFRTLSIFFREHHLILLRREDLKCTFCGSGITTEMLHYIFDCAALSEERRKLNDKTGQLCPSFPALINEISKNRDRTNPACPPAGRHVLSPWQRSKHAATSILVTDTSEDGAAVPGQITAQLLSTRKAIVHGAAARGQRSVATGGQRRALLTCHRRRSVDLAAGPAAARTSSLRHLPVVGGQRRVSYISAAEIATPPSAAQKDPRMRRLGGHKGKFHQEQRCLWCGAWRARNDAPLGISVGRAEGAGLQCDARKTKLRPSTTSPDPARGCHSENLRSIFRHPDTKQIYKPEDRANVVYKIPCKSCQAIYIGETSKPLSERINQHKSALKHHNPTSLLVDHAFKNSHTPDFDHTSIIHQNIKEKHCRLFLESWSSLENKNSINRKIDLPDVYTQFRTS
ncbi:hypothetical protein LAZ67_X001133 [Cordylochernes scorpioides]|uniref:Endonuclease-reverse transcriptase n=1 Tax=Cordylochernes scorpioides TaxID=51811 RepID=A0ABY6LS79_9ARAC|nr:hypothetical protein LAZ67_X001133 [Cordylochernes scorpioides]